MIQDQWLIIIGCLFFSALFSGLEIAFITSDKLYFELKSKKGGLSGKILSTFHERPSNFIATMLVGNNLALALYGLVMAQILQSYISAALPEFLNTDFIVLGLQTLISTVIVLVTAEFTPKSLFLINPDYLLEIFALPLAIIYYVMYPAVFLITIASKVFIVYVLRQEYAEDKPVFGLVDLNNYIKKTLAQASETDSPEVDTKIFNNALEFKTIRVRDCMIPRTEIVAVDIEDGIDELKQAFVDSGHSKILVYKESIDDVKGYCHSLELFKKPKDLKSILTPIIIVPETTLANELLIQFITDRKSLALVVDEYGGTSGVVSIEDIMEEIFGEIQDEHDEEEHIEEQIDAFNYIFSARLEIDYLNDEYSLDLPEGDYDTLGGFILSINEDIPDINDVVEHEQFEFTILSMEDARIDKVKLSISELTDRE
ncbi:MAG: hemolysin family protein [Bacteroidota bacterium]